MDQALMRAIALVLLCAIPCWGQGATFNGIVNSKVQSVATTSPALISSYAGGIDNALYGNNGNVSIGSPSLIVNLPTAFVGGSNNCAVLVVTGNSTYTISTPTDNESETWTAGPTVTGANTKESMFYVLGDTASTNEITITYAGTPGGTFALDLLGAIVQEFKNCGAIGGTGTLDTSATGSALTLTLSSAPSSGDMALGYFLDTMGQGATPTPFNTTISPGSGFTAMSRQFSFGKLSELNTSTTSTSVQATYNGTDTILGVGLVIKKGSAGTNAPAGKFIDHYQVEQVPASTTPSFFFPCSGNLITGSLGGIPTAFVSSITGSSGTWSTGVTHNTNNLAQIVYATGVTCSSTLTISPTFAATPATPGTELALASWSNMAGTFDTSAGGSGDQTAAANFSVGGSSSGSTSITPSATNEVTVATASISWHTLTGTAADTHSHTPTILSSTMNKGDDAESPCTTATPNSTLDEDNGYAYYINASDTNPITFIWPGTQTSGSCTSTPTGVLFYDWVGASFK
jgi:hypothetical protein